MRSKRLVVDANILIRSALGVRVRSILRSYEETVSFHAPGVCFADARKYIVLLAEERGFDPAPSLATLSQMALLVEELDIEVYEEYETQARERLGSLDAKDWPIAAAALALNCPVWTEDQDFFGSGIPTWTTRTVEIYLRDA